jgi:hypothetical protein
MSKKNALFCPVIGVLYSFSSPERFKHPVNVHWLLFTVGTFIFKKSHKR